MLCENCKKNAATTYFKQTVNGNTREVFLCSECAAKLGLGDPMSGFGNFGMGFGMMSDLLGAMTQSSSVCPTCGMSLNEVSKSGRVGCADCYDSFRDYLRRLIPRISGNKAHAGKTPRSVKPAADDLGSLRKQLEEAIKSENFEEATVLRDKIREIEQKNRSGNGSDAK